MNLAWENAISLTLNLKEWKLEEADTDGEIREEYWKAAQRLLASGAALAQQGIELLLKSRIVASSPFLLIAGDPRAWPSGCDKTPTPFADFRTIDAQDLMRVHDTVHPKPLSDEFKRNFEKSRRLRNTIFHTVDRRAKVKVEDILRTIFIASEVLIGPQQWLKRRRQFIEETPESVPNGGEFSQALLVRELVQIIELFGKAEVERFVGLRQRGRRYLCYWCEHECRTIFNEHTAFCAQLSPNEPTSTNLHCFACGADRKVVRTPCTTKACKSNVIDDEDAVCCVCYQGQDEWPPAKA